MLKSGHKTHSMLRRYNIISEDDLCEAVRMGDAYRKSKAAAQPGKVAVMARKAAGER